MANTGFISSSGIIQVFTSGPYSGSIVTSSYSDGINLFGNIINTSQSFISGTVDFIIPCETEGNIINGVNYFERYYFNPIQCPPLGFCFPPTFISASRNTCVDRDPSIYNIIYNSGSSTADYTIIEYSTSNNFNITGSTILDNSNLTSSIEVLINGFKPQFDAPVYFRAYNSCSNDTISSNSNVVIADNCVFQQPLYPNFTYNIVNQTSYQVETTNGTGNGITGPWFNVPVNNTTGNSYVFNNDTGNFFFKVASPSNCPNQGIYIELTTTTPNISNIVNTNINSTLNSNDCGGNGIGIQTSNYSGITEYYLHFPSNNINTQISTNIFINRINYFDLGNITLTIKYTDPNLTIFEG